MTVSSQATNLANRLLHLMPRLQQWAYASVQAKRDEQDLSLRQLRVLYMIREGTDSPGGLARRLRISPAVVTGLLDRLEQRGYLRRLTDPCDRRRLRIALTETGLAVSLAVERALTQDLAAHFVHATENELAAVERTLDVLEGVVVALERDAPPAGALTDDPEAGAGVPDVEATLPLRYDRDDGDAPLPAVIAG